MLWERLPNSTVQWPKCIKIWWAVPQHCCGEPAKCSNIVSDINLEGWSQMAHNSKIEQWQTIGFEAC